VVDVVDMQMLVGIMDDIQRHYVDSKAEDGRLWVEGQIAISQFTDDGLFYRARVLNVIDADTVEVSSGILSVLGNSVFCPVVLTTATFFILLPPLGRCLRHSVSGCLCLACVHVCVIKTGDTRLLTRHHINHL